MNFLNKFKFEIKNSLTRNSKKKKKLLKIWEKKKERNIRFLILSVNKGGKIALQINSQKTLN